MTRRSDPFPYCEIIEEDVYCTMQFDITPLPEADKFYVFKQLEQYCIQSLSDGIFKIYVSNKNIATSISHDLNAKYFDKYVELAKADIKSRLGLDAIIDRAVYPGFIQLKISREKNQHEQKQIDALIEKYGGKSRVIIDDS